MPRVKPIKMLWLRESQLLHHPENMRRTYPDSQVADMAASIRAAGGVEQALLVVAAPRGKYYVVDGNLRLEGARRLGAQCPLLKCELRQQSGDEQNLTMARTDLHRFAVDPISRAAHYRKIIIRRKCSVQDLAKQIGVKRKVVDDHLLLLKLPAEVQDLIAEGRMVKDPRVARALLALPPEAAASLARRMAGSASIKAILAAADRLCQNLAQRPAARPKGPPPALCRVRERKRHPAPGDPPALRRPGPMPDDGQKVPWPEVRAQAQRTCEACEVKADSLATASAPAWSLIAQHSAATCGDCSVAAIRFACDACPQVDLLRRLARTFEPHVSDAAPSPKS